MTDRPLTPKEQAFVDAYIGVSEGNGTDACRRAGYKGDNKTLGVQAARLLAKDRIRSALASFRLEVAAEAQQVHRAAILTSAEVAVRLSAIGMGMVPEKRVVGGKDDFVEVELPPPCSTQVKALDSLSDLMGYKAASKVEHSGLVGLDVQLSPETQAALDEWLIVRTDPVIKARLLELRGAE